MPDLLRLLLRSLLFFVSQYKNNNFRLIALVSKIYLPATINTCNELLTFNGTSADLLQEEAVDEIMASVAQVFGYTVNKDWDEDATDGDTVIYKVPSADLYNWLLLNPNTTQFAILWSPEMVWNQSSIQYPCPTRELLFLQEGQKEQGLTPITCEELAACNEARDCCSKFGSVEYISIRNLFYGQNCDASPSPNKRSEMEQQREAERQQVEQALEEARAEYRRTVYEPFAQMMADRELQQQQAMQILATRAIPSNETNITAWCDANQHCDPQCSMCTSLCGNNCTCDPCGSECGTACTNRALCTVEQCEADTDCHACECNPCAPGCGNTCNTALCSVSECLADSACDPCACDDCQPGCGQTCSWQSSRCTQNDCFADSSCDACECDPCSGDCNNAACQFGLPCGVEACVDDLDCDLCSCNPARPGCYFGGLVPARTLHSSYVIITNTTEHFNRFGNTWMDMLASVNIVLNADIAAYHLRAASDTPSTGSLKDYRPSYEFAIRNYPAADLSVQIDTFQQFGGLFIYCAMMLNFVMFLYKIVQEKDLGLRLGMRMIGMSDTAYWLTWFLYNVLYISLYTAIILILGYAFQFNFFLRTDFFVLFLTFFLFGLAMTPFAMFWGMLFSTTRSAIIFGLLVFVFGVIFQLVLSINFAVQAVYLYTPIKDWLPVLLSLYPPFNFARIVNNIAAVSNNAAAEILIANGNTSLIYVWDDLYKQDNVSVIKANDSDPDEYIWFPADADTFWWQLLCVVLYSVSAWYYYNVMSAEKGDVPWFMFTLRYWRRYGVPDPTAPDLSHIREHDDDVQQETHDAPTSDAELRMFDLHKTYSGFEFKNRRLRYSRKEVVKGVSYTVRKGQVFALLGHNGAGKTTTINMLTGVVPPSKGDAFIHGKSIRTQLPDVQRLLGVCPQHNVLWDDLSPLQHLWIFSALKNVPREERKQLAKDRLEDVLLWDVRDKACGKFSGGMKRRLSVAISAIGNPQVIFLDEPTTGLDPMSRREIWGAIHRLKKDRVIILTSHSMEEADVLGDRVGVMADGKLRCIGTSLHLKNKFGLGYRLNLSGDVHHHEAARALVQKHIPDAQMLKESGGQFVFAVPTKHLAEAIAFIKVVEEGLLVQGGGAISASLEPAEPQQVEKQKEKENTKQEKHSSAESTESDAATYDSEYDTPSQPPASSPGRVVIDKDQIPVENQFPIQDWGLSQTTLEEVFFAVAEQPDE